MEDFQLIQVEFKDILDLDIPKNSFSIKIMNDSFLTSFNYPFPTVYIPVLNHKTPQIFVYSNFSQISQSIFPELSCESSKKTEFSIPVSLSSEKKFNLTVFLSIIKPKPEVVPEELIKKYKEDLKEIDCLKRILLESIEEISEDLSKGFTHEIGIDLEMINSTQTITRQQSEHLKGIILGLNEKLKILQTIEIVLREIEKKSKNDLSARENMQTSLKNVCNEMENLKEHHQNLLKSMQNTLNEAHQKLSDSLEKNRENAILIKDLEGKIQILEGEKQELKSEIKNFEDMAKMIRSLQENIKGLEENREKMREDFAKLQQDYDLLIEKKDQEFIELTDVNTSLEKKVEMHETEISNLKTTLNTQESLILTLSSTVESHLSEINALKDQENKAHSMEALAKKHQQECIKSNENIQKTTSKFSEVIKNINSEKIKLLKNTADLQSTIKNLSEQIQAFQETLNSENAKCIDLKSQNDSLQSTINSGIDAQHISRQLLKLHSNFIKAKLKFSIDSAIFVKSLQQIAYELMNNTRFIEQLKGILMNRDEEIAILKDIITELQRRIPYVGTKDDPIDLAMAEYVNSLEEPLEIPFVKEDQGIYLFGSKRIFVKLDNGKLSSKI